MKNIVTKFVPVSRDAVDKRIIKDAADIIRNGGLVAFPTETVYGLGADALKPDSTDKIYRAKNRPGDNPLIAHIADLKDIYMLVSSFPENAEKTAKRFWPGPLTMILNKSEKVPYSITGGRDTVAVRMPADEIARELIRECKTPVAAPSANTSGRPSPTTAWHVYEDMNGKIDMILDGGEVKIGLESTIVDMTSNPPVILRPGAVTREMLEEVLGQVIGEGVQEDDCAPKAPGMKYTHYAPKARLTVIEGSGSDVMDKMKELSLNEVKKGRSTGLIITDENRSSIEEDLGEFIKRGDVLIECIASCEDEESIAHNLFATLRNFDKRGADIIFSESFSGSGLRAAIMNRLMKAAGNRKIIV